MNFPFPESISESIWPDVWAQGTQVIPESAGGEEASLEEAPGTWFLLPLLTSPTPQGSIIENHQL